MRRAALKPSKYAADLEKAGAVCHDTERMDIIAFSVQIEATGEEYYRQFTAICRAGEGHQGSSR